MKLDSNYNSLSEVHQSVDTTTGHKRKWRRMLSFFGPAYLVSVGYMDPGNWATDLAGGSQFGYKLIWVLLMSNLMALLLQSLSARLGIVRGRDLAQANRETYPKYVNYGLLKNKDTTTIRYPEFAGFIGDSLKNKLFGKTSKPKYVGMFRMDAGQGYTYYMVKAISGAKRAALLLIFNQDQYEAVFPFLIPDNNPSTSQLSSIDKSFSIQKGVTLKKPGNLTSEGRDVFVYDPSSKQFSLILTNPLDNVPEVVLNPIDTLPRKHRFAGDYTKDKKNFISIRDGRYPNQLMVFIHLDKNEGECTGELKGDILLTSTTAAIYRQGGDACVLSFRFSSSSVTIKEEEGCGGHRGLNCTFDGTYPRKKEAKPKATTKKKTAK